MDSPDQSESALEQFRQQWKAEVEARAKKPGHSKSKKSTTVASSAGSRAAQKAFARQHANLPVVSQEEEDDSDSHEIVEKEHGRKLDDNSYGVSLATKPQEPKTALEHYEKAAESEGKGRLGESLSHYRTAFKLDPRVQDKYKNKHFPAAKPFQSNTIPTTATTDTAASAGPATSTVVKTILPITDLIRSFENVRIEGELPPTQLSPAPPCPISQIPEEVLIEAISATAQLDMPSLVRLSQVSKRLAYLISTEESLWRPLMHHPDYGLAAMHWDYACTLEWEKLVEDSQLDDLDAEFPKTDAVNPFRLTLPLSPTYPTYRQMFRTRPRIRFNGCYISTVNYTRPGAIGSNTLTWNHNILIVTYYRYLRFFRDGTLISLLTTSEPSDVVPYLQKEYIHFQSQGGGLPQVVMKDSLKGRWYLSGDPYNIKPAADTESNDTEEPVEPEAEGDIHIETEGVVSKYKYIMQLRFASAGRGARNNKLNWVGYWCHNKLTDDVGEFGLKNDRPYFWSRVKSWY